MIAELYGDVEPAPEWPVSRANNVHDHPLTSQPAEESPSLSSEVPDGYPIYPDRNLYSYSPNDRLMKAQLKEYIECDPLEDGDDPQVITSTWLRSISCYVHKRLRTFICRTCRTGIRPEQMLAHLQRHRLPHALSQESLAYTMRYYNILPFKDVKRPKRKDPIPYLPIADGLGCRYPNCNYACISSGSFAKHVSTHHKNNPSSRQDELLPHPRKIKVQTVFLMPIVYFEVVEPPPPTTTAYEQWMKQIQDMPNTRFSPRGNSISHSDAAEDMTPFLQFTQWNIHLSEQRQDKAKGTALFKAASKPTELSGFETQLWNTVQHYFSYIGKLIQSTPHIMRRLLLQWPLYVFIYLKIDYDNINWYTLQ